jgi:hypothetical protein
VKRISPADEFALRKMISQTGNTAEHRIMKELLEEIDALRVDNSYLAKQIIEKNNAISELLCVNSDQLNRK